MRAAWTLALCALLLASGANAGLLDAVKEAADTVGGAVANTTESAVGEQS